MSPEIARLADSSPGTLPWEWLFLLKVHEALVHRVVKRPNGKQATCLHLCSKHPKAAMCPNGTDFLPGLGCSQDGHSVKSLQPRANRGDSVLHVCPRKGPTPPSPFGPSAVPPTHSHPEEAKDLNMQRTQLHCPQSG